MYLEFTAIQGMCGVHLCDCLREFCIGLCFVKQKTRQLFLSSFYYAKIRF